MALEIVSPAFEAGGEIPREHTCDGADRSPPLAWRGVPNGTRSLALIVDDPDAPDPAAPKTVWVHWVVFNIPAGVTACEAGETPAGAREGLNDWGQPGYRGPCPPVGRHRYFFKLYALDAELPDMDSPTKARLEQAMAGHVLAEAQLVGHYQR